MSKTAYNITLKGYVGGADFDRKTVDRTLADNDGNVNVHFVGLNASAATIASLGAAHISIDAGAMYLVHKCSMAFFEWGSLNSDQFATLIADCEKIKVDLAMTPAEPSKQVVEDSKTQGATAPKNDVERFVDTCNSAQTTPSTSRIFTL